MSGWAKWPAWEGIGACANLPQWLVQLSQRDSCRVVLYWNKVWHVKDSREHISKFLSNNRYRIYFLFTAIISKQAEIIMMELLLLKGFTALLADSDWINFQKHVWEGFVGISHPFLAVSQICLKNRSSALFPLWSWNQPDIFTVIAVNDRE